MVMVIHFVWRGSQAMDLYRSYKLTYVPYLCGMDFPFLSFTGMSIAGHHMSFKRSAIVSPLFVFGGWCDFFDISIVFRFRVAARCDG